MKVPENRRAQKMAAGDSIVVGDWIYRATTDHGDLMMIVTSVGRGVHEGIDAIIFSGDVFTMSGEGAGPQAAFLGDMTATRAGTGTWKLPVDKQITVGCGVEDADWQFPETSEPLG
jgi:hypothetical protein